MVEVRECDVVPGETSRGTGFEGWEVERKVGDDHVHNLGREPARSSRISEDVWVPTKECALEFGLGTIPGDIGNELYPCGY